MTQSGDPSTRELIAEGEKLRSKPSDGSVPKTRQIVRESERLIGREEGRSGGRAGLVIAVLAGVLLLGLGLLLGRVL